jgi:glycosyltransferase involved in cell wall biosynthesis
VLFAGRVVPAKGLAVLVRAVARIDAELVVCGDGWQLGSLRRLARRLGIEERVTLRGWLSAAQLARELEDAAVVALPSLWPEPFGLVGIEAHLARRPVVASATGGVGEWLEDGVSGLLTPPGDVRALARALEELLGDPARCAAMGEAGRHSVLSRFTAEQHVASALAAYERARGLWLASDRGALAS